MTLLNYNTFEHSCDGCELSKAIRSKMIAATNIEQITVYQCALRFACRICPKLRATQYTGINFFRAERTPEAVAVSGINRQGGGDLQRTPTRGSLPTVTGGINLPGIPQTNLGVGWW